LNLGKLLPKYDQDFRIKIATLKKKLRKTSFIDTMVGLPRLVKGLDRQKVLDLSHYLIM